MNCPIESAEDWKRLVKHAGSELSAMDMYIENNYVVPPIIEGNSEVIPRYENYTVEDLNNFKILQVQKINMSSLMEGNKSLSFRAGTSKDNFDNVNEGDLLRVRSENTLTDTFVKVTGKKTISNFKGDVKPERKDDFAKALGFENFEDYRKKDLYANSDSTSSVKYPDTYKFINGDVPGTIITYEQVAIKPQLENKSDVSAEQLLKATKIKTRALATLETSLSLYDSATGKDDLTEKELTKIKGYEKSLTDAIKEFISSDFNESVISFIDRGSKDIKGILKRLDNEDLTPKNLKQMYDFVQAYQLFSDIDSLLLEGEDIFGDKTKELSDKVKSLISDIGTIERTYQNKAIEFMAPAMASQSSYGYIIRRNELKKEYTENNPYRSFVPVSRRKKRDEYDKAKNEWVEGELSKDNGEILKRETRRIKSLLLKGEKDLDSFIHRIVDIASINDTMIRHLLTLVDEADHVATQDFLTDKISVIDKYQEFKKGKSSNIDELYSGLYEIDKNGKATPYYVRELYHQWYEGKDKYDRVDKNISLTDAEKNKLKLGLKKRYLANSKGEWSEGNAKTLFKNPQWGELQQDNDKLEMYNFLIDFNKESDSMVDQGKRLGYRLPGMNKDDWENLTSKGLIGATKEGIKESVKFTAADEHLYGIATDPSGRPLKEVLTPFRNKADNQSFDLVGLALTNRYISRNFKEKSKAKLEAEMISDLLRLRSVAEKNNGKPVLQRLNSLLKEKGIDGEEQREVLTPGQETNIYKAYNEVMDMRLYGRQRIKTGKIDKWADMMQSFSSYNFMVLNTTSAVTNTLNGKMLNYFESVGKQLYTGANLRSAEAKYFKDSINMTKDAESLYPKARTNLFLNKFAENVLSFNGINNSLSRDNKLKRAMSMKSFHVMSQTTEHYIQATAMYAIVDNMKVKNSKGEYVNKKGEVVSDRKDAASMDEMYTEDNGKLIWNSEYIPEGFDSIEEAEFKVNRKVKETIKRLQGNYNTQTRALIERYWYGRSAMFMRKWMVPGIQKRWRNISFSNMKLEEIPAEFRIYNEQTMEEIEGTYTSTVRFLRQNLKEIKSLKFQLLADNWNTLSDMERANIRIAVREQLVMQAALWGSVFLANLAEEEDEEWLYASAYFSRRLYSELMFYTPFDPPEAMRTLRTPSATLNTIELITKTTSQALEDVLYNIPFGEGAEVYESGKRKGDIKSIQNMSKLVNPLHKVGDMDYKSKLKFLMNR